jgi:DNA-binding MarR family transcriptional regulator
MALKENSLKVLNYVREHDGENMTAADIAEGTGLEVKSVNGIVTAAFQKKGLMERTPAEIEVTEDGKTTHKAVKFISLTEAGRAFDENAEVEEAK